VGEVLGGTFVDDLGSPGGLELVKEGRSCRGLVVLVVERFGV
jgi:hypothetical protein